MSDTVQIYVNLKRVDAKVGQQCFLQRLTIVVAYHEESVVLVVRQTFEVVDPPAERIVEATDFDAIQTDGLAAYRRISDAKYYFQRQCQPTVGSLKAY